MSSLKLRGAIAVPPVVYATDYRSVFRDAERKGKVTRYECFRLQVEDAFRLISKAPATLIAHWELTRSLSSQELRAELQTMVVLQSWQLHHLVIPRDASGMAQPSLFRRLRRGVVLMPVTGDDSLSLVDVSLPQHGAAATAPLILSLATERSGFNAGLSLFSLCVNP